MRDDLDKDRNGPSFTISGRRAHGLSAMTEEDVARKAAAEPAAAAKLLEQWRRRRDGINLPDLTQHPRRS